MSDALKSQCIKGFESASGQPPKTPQSHRSALCSAQLTPFREPVLLSGALPPFFRQYFFGRPLSFFPSISSRRPGLPKRFKGPKSAPVPGPARAFLHALAVRLF